MFGQVAIILFLSAVILGIVAIAVVGLVTILALSLCCLYSNSPSQPEDQSETEQKEEQ